MRRAQDFLEPTQIKAYVKKVRSGEVERHRSQFVKDRKALETRGAEPYRPKTRSQCPTVRPCPYISCRHHLYLEIKDTGHIKFVFGDLPLEALEHTCSLDVAEAHHDGLELGGVGAYVNLTRERVRQIERDAIEKLKGVLELESDEDVIAYLQSE